jgi:hypothetical protein
MSEETFRPWGLLHWVLSRSGNNRWSLLGCFGTEKRSLAAWQTLKTAGRLGSTFMVRVDDPPSRFDAEIRARLAGRRVEWEGLGGALSQIHVHRPTESVGHLIESVRTFLGTAGSSVVIDITSMPKRVFFPLLKILRKDPRLANIMATYTIPESYPSIPIAADFQEWQPLPLFSGNPSPSWHPDMMVVGIGYMAMRLGEEINPTRRELPVKLIFPFPPGPPGFHRSWDMVRVLEEAQERQTTEIRRVDAKDASDTFEHLRVMTNNGERSAVFAPFGPKPISLAMCLFADETNAPVYYTQPRAYHPDYSLGIAEIDGRPEIYSYYLRMGGREFYKVK